MVVTAAEVLPLDAVVAVVAVVAVAAAVVSLVPLRRRSDRRGHELHPALGARPRLALGDLGCIGQAYDSAVVSLPP